MFKKNKSLVLEETTTIIEQALSAYLQTQDKATFSRLLKSSEIDWAELWKAIRIHKLQPIFHKILQEHQQLQVAELSKERPIPIFPQLKRYRMQQLRRSLFKLKELQRTIAAFETAGIRITPYKGMAFAQCFYGDISLRSSVDIDMAIAVSDIPASFAIMRSLGYEEYSKEKTGETSEKKKLAATRAYHIDYSWVLYQGKRIVCNIEFHWQPAHPVLQVPLTFEQLSEDAYTTICIGGPSISTFTKPYLALFTLIHHGLIDTWGQYRHLLDFAKILQGLTREEYQKLQTMLEKYQLQQCFYTGVYLVTRLFNLPFANTGYQANKHRKIGDHLLTALHTNSLAGKWSDNPRKLLYHLRMRDTLGQQVRTSGSLMWFKIRF